MPLIIMSRHVTGIGRFDTTTPVSLSLHDLIPLLNPGHFLRPNPRYAPFRPLYRWCRSAQEPASAYPSLFSLVIQVAPDAAKALRSDRLMGYQVLAFAALMPPTWQALEVDGQAIPMVRFNPGHPVGEGSSRGSPAPWPAVR